MRILCITLLFSLLTSWALADDFYLNRDGTVTDLRSALVWQGNSQLAASSAKALANCRKARRNSPYRWRLPSFEELQKLEARLSDPAPSIYWAVAGEIQAGAGLYCFSDGAFFPLRVQPGSAQVRCVADDPLASIYEALRFWASAWERGDVESYLSAYLPDFRPANGISHQAWRVQRRQRLARAGDIRLRLQAEAIRPLNADQVEIIFLQEYEASTYQDRVRKRLLLNLQQGRWLIQREDQLSILQTDAFLPTALIY